MPHRFRSVRGMSDARSSPVHHQTIRSGPHAILHRARWVVTEGNKRHVFAVVRRHEIYQSAFVALRRRGTREIACGQIPVVGCEEGNCVSTAGSVGCTCGSISPGVIMYCSNCRSILAPREAMSGAKLSRSPTARTFPSSTATAVA